MNLSLQLLALLAALVAPVSHAVEYRAVLPKQSAIDFEFRQMGVPVKGGFTRFTTQMIFDPAPPIGDSSKGASK